MNETVRENICYTLYCMNEATRNEEAAVKHKNGCLAEQAARYWREAKETLLTLPEDIRQEMVEANPELAELI